MTDDKKLTASFDLVLPEHDVNDHCHHDQVPYLLDTVIVNTMHRKRSTHCANRIGDETRGALGADRPSLAEKNLE